MIIQVLSNAVEFANRWLSLSGLMFRDAQNIVARVEKMMVAITFLCIGIFLTITLIPRPVALVIAILLVQRVIEFFLVYTRHFIFNKGLIFAHFDDVNELGQWFIVMFSLSLTQVILVFSTWYQLLSTIDPAAFSQALGTIDSLYFSLITFLTIGYGDIVPVSPLARSLVIVESVLTFYTLVIVINGMISIHFSTPKHRPKKED